DESVSRNRASFCKWQIILTEMNCIGLRQERDVNPIVDTKSNAPGPRQLAQCSRSIEKLLRASVLAAQLQDPGVRKQRRRLLRPFDDRVVSADQGFDSRHTL